MVLCTGLSCLVTLIGFKTGELYSGFLIAKADKATRGDAKV